MTWNQKRETRSLRPIRVGVSDEKPRPERSAASARTRAPSLTRCPGSSSSASPRLCHHAWRPWLHPRASAHSTQASPCGLWASGQDGGESRYHFTNSVRNVRILSSH